MSLFGVVLLLGAGTANNALAALVRIVEPYTSTDTVVSPTTSDVPTFEWTSSGAISRFELQLSDQADFRSYWYRPAAGTTRSLTYASRDWSRFNTTVTAPGRLLDGTGYFLRINAYAANGTPLAESMPVPFTARALVSGTYCNPDFDVITPENANPHRTRGVHVVPGGRIDPSFRVHVIPGETAIQSQVYDSTDTLLCTLTSGPILRSRAGIPSKGLNATMTMRFDLRTQDYFDRITGAGPHIPVVLLGDMASLPSVTGGTAGSEGIGPIFGDLSNWIDSGNCVKPRLTDGDTSGNLTVIESFRNSRVCLFGNQSINYQKLTDQTYHVEIRATPVLRGVDVIRNRISYKVTTASGVLVAQAENLVDDTPPTTRMHGGWLLLGLIGGQSSLPPFDLWFENLVVDYAPAVTVDGLPVGNDLLVAYPSPTGLLLKSNNGSWTTAYRKSPLRMANGDIDADGVSDVLMDFGSTGIWLWRSGAPWRAVYPSSARELVATDLDANGKTDFIVNFGPPRGLYAYMDDGTWRQLHSVPPRQVVSANLDGDPRRDLVVDFGPPYGIWLYLNDTDWVALHGISATDIVVGDLDGNGIDDIVVDFGSQYGIWIYMNQADWVPLHGVSSQQMTIGNFDSDPRKDLVVDFGPQYGIWIWKNNSAWQPVHGAASERLRPADLDRNGIDDLVVDFGPPFGLWAWMNGVTWVQQSGASPQEFIAIDADRD